MAIAITEAMSRIQRFIFICPLKKAKPVNLRHTLAKPFQGSTFSRSGLLYTQNAI